MLPSARPSHQSVQRHLLETHAVGGVVEVHWNDVLREDGAYDFASVRADLLGLLLSWRLRHDDRTLTGYLLSDNGLAYRRDERRG